MVGRSSIRGTGQSTLTDTFGTIAVYPTKSGGLEKAVDMVTSTPASAGMRSHFNGASWVKSGDGLYWQVTNDNGGGATGAGRVGINSDSGNKWVNIEMTVYLKRTGGARQFQLGWGGVHNTQGTSQQVINAGHGYANKTRFTGIAGDGLPTSYTAAGKLNATMFVKEMGHPAYCDETMYGGTPVSITGNPNNLITHDLELWQGYKFVRRVWNNGGIHKVVMESYIDVNCETPPGTFLRRNDWRKLNTFIDVGVWTAIASEISAGVPAWHDNTWPTIDQDNAGYEADYSNTLREPDEILNTGGPGYSSAEKTINDAYIRTDGGTNYGLRDFTVRELDPIA